MIIINNAIGLDVQQNKLRYMRRYGVPLVRGSIFALPFGDATFDCVVCSQVIEHIREDPVIFTEFVRGKNASGRGFGLGLAICRRVMEAHGGAIRLIPSGQGGTRFEMTFPDPQAMN